MFRLWARIFQNNHMLRDTVIEDPSEETRTHKVYNALAASAKEFDVATPIWLDKNIRDFKRYSHTRFTADNFIEQIEFDYLEIRIIEED